MDARLTALAFCTYYLRADTARELVINKRDDFPVRWFRGHQFAKVSEPPILAAVFVFLSLFTRVSDEKSVRLSRWNSLSSYSKRLTSSGSRSSKYNGVSVISIFLPLNLFCCFEREIIRLNRATKFIVPEIHSFVSSRKCGFFCKFSLFVVYACYVTGTILAVFANSS